VLKRAVLKVLKVLKRAVQKVPMPGWLTVGWCQECYVDNRRLSRFDTSNT
jgi:hypothetical protein